DSILHLALEGIVLPLGRVADADRVYVRVDGDQARPGADLHEEIAKAVDPDFVGRAKLLDFLFDAVDDVLFGAAVAFDGDDVAEEGDHVGFVLLGKGGDGSVLHVLDLCCKDDRGERLSHVGGQGKATGGENTLDLRTQGGVERNRFLVEVQCLLQAAPVK